MILCLRECLYSILLKSFCCVKDLLFKYVHIVKGPRADQKENIPVLVKRFLNCKALAYDKKG